MNDKAFNLYQHATVLIADGDRKAAAVVLRKAVRCSSGEAREDLAELLRQVEAAEVRQ